MSISKPVAVGAFTCATLCLLACGRTPLDERAGSVTTARDDAGAARDSTEGPLSDGPTDVIAPDDAAPDRLAPPDAALDHADATDRDGVPDAPPFVDAVDARDAGADRAIDAPILADAAEDAAANDAKDATLDRPGDARVVADAVDAKDATLDRGSEGRTSLDGPTAQDVGHGEAVPARAFAIDDRGNLLDVELPSGDTRLIGASKIGLTDIALAPDGRLFGLEFDGANELDPRTGAVLSAVQLTKSDLNAMDVTTDGTLYVAGGQNLYTLDLVSGALVDVMRISQGWSSGDLAFVAGHLFLTGATNDTHDQLFELDPVAGSARLVGETGYDCIYGLAADGPSLYGMTCNGQVLSLDTTTGKGTVLQETGIVFWGASAR